MVAFKALETSLIKRKYNKTENKYCFKRIGTAIESPNKIQKIAVSAFEKGFLGFSVEKLWQSENIKVVITTGNMETLAPKESPKKNQYFLFNKYLFFLKKTKNKDKKNSWRGSGFGIVM